MINLHLYSDGGAYNAGPKKGRGSWAFVIISGGEQIHGESQQIEGTTNNRTEYISFLEGVKKCIEIFSTEKGFHKITAYSDSNLLVSTWNTWLTGWIRKGIVTNKCNSDLLEEMIRLKGILLNKEIEVDLKWVRGHSGNKWNEVCDRMCTEALNR